MRGREERARESDGDASMGELASARERRNEETGKREGEKEIEREAEREIACE